MVNQKVVDSLLKLFEKNYKAWLSEKKQLLAELQQLRGQKQ